MKKASSEHKVLEKTLNRLSARRSAPLSVFIVLLLFYLVAAFMVSATAGSKADILIFGLSIPIYSVAGIFSVISEIAYAKQFSGSL